MIVLQIVIAALLLWAGNTLITLEKLSSAQATTLVIITNQVGRLEARVERIESRTHGN